MNHTSRRRFLQVLGAAGAGAALTQPVMNAFADPGVASDEFFIFIHAAGGWDVTLWSDPRNQPVGLIDPASTDTVVTDGLTQWQNDTPFDGDTSSFKLIKSGNFVFGPAIGNLLDKASRMTLFNGVAMNTVAHPDGTYFSSTGRHLAGGRPVATSIDTLVANEFGTSQLFPGISVNFPSTFLDHKLDQRALPLRVTSIGTIGKSMTRSNSFTTAADRDSVTVALSAEALDLAASAQDPGIFQGFDLQYQALRKMLNAGLIDLFDANKLKAAQPDFNYTGKYQGPIAINAAFAVEAMKRNVVRSVSFATNSHDTHNTNYRNHGQILQETLNLISTLVDRLDATPHPTKPNDKLSDHTHILVVSEFCRTPQINVAGGRDHYPNNSALVISPKFQGNTVFGKSDPEQLLPMDAGTFADGTRAVAPPDILATLLAAFGVDPRKYLRDGDVIKAVLKA
jgi:hypothetical protein